MSRITNQYKDSSKLSARAQLYARFSTEEVDWSRWVFDWLDLAPASRTLELGCGTGHLWARNMDRVPEGWQVTLTDASPGMLQEAQANLRGSDSRFRFEIVDAQSIPYEDSTFDGVIANHMLYHVPDKPRALSEIHRVLRPGGRLFATTHGRDHLRKLSELVEKVAPDAYDRWIASDNFGLENGAGQLARWFTKVSVHRSEGSLVVTEADALVTYVRSTELLSADQLLEFEEVCAREIGLRGAIRIDTDVGMFEAVKEKE